MEANRKHMSWKQGCVSTVAACILVLCFALVAFWIAIKSTATLPPTFRIGFQNYTLGSYIGTCPTAGSSTARPCRYTITLTTATIQPQLMSAQMRELFSIPF